MKTTHTPQNTVVNNVIRLYIKEPRVCLVQAPAALSRHKQRILEIEDGLFYEDETAIDKTASISGVTFFLYRCKENHRIFLPI